MTRTMWFIRLVASLTGAVVAILTWDSALASSCTVNSVSQRGDPCVR